MTLPLLEQDAIACLGSMIAILNADKHLKWATSLKIRKRIALDNVVNPFMVGEGLRVLDTFITAILILRRPWTGYTS